MITPMIVLALLIGPGFLAWCVSPSSGFNAWTPDKRALGLALCFSFFGFGHFAQTEGMIAMLPEFIPARRELVWLTGVGEWLVAIGLLIDRYRSIAVAVALAILVGFFPVNIWAAWHEVGLGGHQWGLVYLWIRAPLQAILLWWSVRLLAGQSPFTGHRKQVAGSSRAN